MTWENRILFSIIIVIAFGSFGLSSYINGKTAVRAAQNEAMRMVMHEADWLTIAHIQHTQEKSK